MSDPLAKRWIYRYLMLAWHVSAWSKDPSTKVGSVIVDNHNAVVSLGFNGFPRGVKDTKERYDDRELKYKMIVHAEINAMAFAQRDLDGFSLFTYPFMPCSVCAGQVIQRGIKNVYAPYSENERWVESFKLTRQMFQEAGVELHEYKWTDWTQIEKVIINPETGLEYK